jgi:hypothetical protein
MTITNSNVAQQVKQNTLMQELFTSSILIAVVEFSEGITYWFTSGRNMY